MRPQSAKGPAARVKCPCLRPQNRRNCHHVEYLASVVVAAGVLNTILRALMSKFKAEKMNKELFAGSNRTFLMLVGILIFIIAMVVPLYGIFLANSFFPGEGKKHFAGYQAEPARSIRAPHFSADESQFVVTVCDPCKIGIYTIATENLVYLKPPKDSVAYHAIFDTQSKTIAFILQSQVAPNAYDFQLAVSQIDGTGLKILTSSDTRKRFPAYSFDGKKLIFSGQERCRGTSTSYCGEDIYEYDLQTKTERRVTNFQALQVGPAKYLPGNERIVAPIIGSINADGVRTRIEDKYGKDRLDLIIDANKPTHFEQLDLDTSTISSPRPLSSGELAFMARDVFLWSKGSARRLTNFDRYIRDYAISDSAQSVLLLMDEKQDISKCERALILWRVADQSSKELRCELPAQESPLVP